MGGEVDELIDGWIDTEMSERGDNVIDGRMNRWVTGRCWMDG